MSDSTNRLLTASQKFSLRTSILDRNLERERAYLLAKLDSSHGNLNRCTRSNSNSFQSVLAENHAADYGSTQRCESNDCDGGYVTKASSDECGSNNHLKVTKPNFLRSFSSGASFSPCYSHTNNNEKELSFPLPDTNLEANCEERFDFYAAGPRADLPDCLQRNLLQPPQKRYEIPAVYFLGRGGSARASFSSTTGASQRLTSHCVKFQDQEQRLRVETSPTDLLGLSSTFQLSASNGGLQAYFNDRIPNMNRRNSPSFRNSNNNAFDEAATSANFHDTNDLFLNFNAMLERLPELQRELGHRLRRHLQFFFMNPLQKYQIRRQFPFKLFLQILKVVFITIQLVLFAELRISHVDFLDDSATVMRHKFLKNWDEGRDAVVYPPDSGKYSVFSSNQIVEHFGYIVKSYYTIHNDSFASFGYDTTFAHRKERGDTALSNEVTNSEFTRIPPIRFCRDRIADVTIQNDTYIFDVSQVKECFSLNFTHDEVKAVIKNELAIREVLERRNISFTAEDALSMSKATVTFNLRTIHFSPLSTDQKPECYLIKVSIEFDNSRHTGQVFVKLNSIISYVNLCNGRVLQVFTLGLDALAIGVIDFFVLLMCMFSLLLCSRALIKAFLLKKTTCDYFGTVFGRRLSVTDQLEFFNLWYVMILINDILIVMGTVCKVTIEFRDFDSDLFTLTGILLGLGALLVYIGLLRYLGFFSQYNILVLTLKRSLPSILRFMVCTIILYVGFLIAGWVIIGPYSIKFRTLSQSSEALFSLLNGDDMFATFYTISDTSTTIKVVGTIYIYFFVCLFIYIVLSLFIAIIMDSYEVVKERYNQGVDEERSTLYEFLASAEPLDEGSSEARELFSSERLLRLDDSWLLQNWSEIHDSLRRTYRNLRHRGGNSVIDNASSPQRNRNVHGGRSISPRSYFDYNSFENPAHDISSENLAGVLSADQRHESEGSLPRNINANIRSNSLTSTLANGSSIAIAVEHSEDQGGDDEYNAQECNDTARYQVSSSRRNSPQTSASMVNDNSDIVRLNNFEPSTQSS